MDPAVHYPPGSLLDYSHFPREVYYDEPMTKYQLCDGSGEDLKCAD